MKERTDYSQNRDIICKVRIIILPTSYGYYKYTMS